MLQAVQERSSITDSLDITQIARDHYDSVFRFCARRVGSDAASDVTQETFVTAQRALRSFRAGSSLKTWLLGIANNECRRHARHWRRSPQALELIEAATPSPEATWISCQALHAAMKKLTPEQKEAVVLVELDGLSYEEAAKVAGVPPGTMKSRLHYAFATLRKALTGETE
jgi:RNA polymerase sigma-70 factor, ECF subfamily